MFIDAWVQVAWHVIFFSLFVICFVLFGWFFFLGGGGCSMHIDLDFLALRNFVWIVSGKLTFCCMFTYFYYFT